ncbi:hypothetical protein M422DRAFT_272399 [Sphaerobolus stellatus SS14]|uniref:Uncharacterized protein n=1 Tax=Sphaerobolus stellatus (strain SS14) TaxID=990650 RepID=A0A0C9UBP8_SPHS4|nr:hypothetical protein M422DRAFT_272399 [Sphaerobolus stellatus SS14]
MDTAERPVKWGPGFPRKHPISGPKSSVREESAPEQETRTGLKIKLKHPPKPLGPPSTPSASEAELEEDILEGYTDPNIDPVSLEEEVLWGYKPRQYLLDEDTPHLSGPLRTFDDNEEQEYEEQEQDKINELADDSDGSSVAKVQQCSTVLVSIVFRVYVEKQTTEKVVLSWDAPWEEFIKEMADALNLAPKNLSLSYRLTTWKKNKWERLTELPKSKASKAKKIQVKAKRRVVRRSVASGGGGGGKRKHNEEEELMDIPDESTPNWLHKLQSKMECSVKGHQYCFIDPNDQHKQLKMSDLGLWANMLENNIVPRDMKTPPLRLGQWDTLPMPRGRGMDSTSSQTALPVVMPQAAPQIIYLQAPPMLGSHSFGGHGMQRDIYVLPSSEPDEMKDPRLFPLVSKWLEDLQNSMAEDGHKFTLYSENFKATKYMRISQLA